MRVRWLAPLLLLLVAAAACGGGGGGHDSTSHDTAAPAAGGPEVAVKASTFKFDPKAITVKAGQPTTIALKSTDIEHDITVDALDIHIHTGPGKTTKGSVAPDKPGSYQFYCSVPGHKSAGMVGTLVVQP